MEGGGVWMAEVCKGVCAEGRVGGRGVWSGFVEGVCGRGVLLMRKLVRSWLKWAGHIERMEGKTEMGGLREEIFCRRGVENEGDGWGVENEGDG